MNMRRRKKERRLRKPHRPTINFVNNLIDGMKKITLNGKELLTEANILFHRKRYSRAFVLAVLSIEEFAKHPLILEFLWSIDPLSKYDINKLRQNLSSIFQIEPHSKKINRSLDFLFRYYPKIKKKHSTQIS
jgi:AbiV family abortive infection protein